MLLLILILVLAAVGGFLGELLEFALWAVVILVVAGAALGYFVHNWFKGLTGRSND